METRAVGPLWGLVQNLPQLPSPHVLALLQAEKRPLGPSKRLVNFLKEQTAFCSFRQSVDQYFLGAYSVPAAVKPGGGGVDLMATQMDEVPFLSDLRYLVGRRENVKNKPKNKGYRKLGPEFHIYQGSGEGQG